MPCQVAPQGTDDGLGEFCWAGCGQANRRNAWLRELFGDMDAYGRMRVQDVSVCRVVFSDGGQGGFRVASACRESVVLAWNGDGASAREFLHEGADGVRILIEAVEEVALEVAGNLDVHAGAEGGVHLASAVGSRIEEAGEDVILIGGEDEPGDGGAHAAGDVTGEDVPEITSGDGNLHAGCACGIHGAECAPEVVDDLRENPCPVDGVDCAQVVFPLELHVIEELLEDALPVVEGSPDGDGMHIGIGQGGHLAFLERADSSLWEHDEDVNSLFAADAMDGGAAGVTAGGADDVEFAAVLGQQVFEEISQKLERHVFEGEGGAVEEFGDEDFAHLLDGDNFLGGEGGVTLLHQSVEIVIRDGAFNIGLHDLVGQFRVGEGAPVGQFAGNIRYLGWDQKASVIRQSHHDCFAEGNRGNAAPGAFVGNAHRCLKMWNGALVGLGQVCKNLYDDFAVSACAAVGGMGIAGIEDGETPGAHVEPGERRILEEAIVILFVEWEGMAEADDWCPSHHLVAGDDQLEVDVFAVAFQLALVGGLVFRFLYHGVRLVSVNLVTAGFHGCQGLRGQEIEDLFKEGMGVCVEFCVGEGVNDHGCSFDVFRSFACRA